MLEKYVNKLTSSAGSWPLVKLSPPPAWCRVACRKISFLCPSYLGTSNPFVLEFLKLLFYIDWCNATSLTLTKLSHAYRSVLHTHSGSPWSFPRPLLSFLDSYLQKGQLVRFCWRFRKANSSQASVHCMVRETEGACGRADLIGDWCIILHTFLLNVGCKSLRSIPGCHLKAAFLYAAFKAVSSTSGSILRISYRQRMIWKNKV